MLVDPLFYCQLAKILTLKVKNVHFLGGLCSAALASGAFRLLFTACAGGEAVSRSRLGFLVVLRFVNFDLLRLGSFETAAHCDF